MPYGLGWARPPNPRPALVVTGAVSPPTVASPAVYGIGTVGGLRWHRDATMEAAQNGCCPFLSPHPSACRT